MSILRDIREYLQQRGHASLDDLAIRFDTSPDAMQGMLNQWIVRGKIRHCPASACQSCQQGCHSAPQQSFEWVVQEESPAISHE